LPPEVVHQIERRIARRHADETSNQPEWSKDWGRLMNTLDDIQDFLSTLATMGRLFLWAAPRIGARFIPGIGWIILGSDLLNLLGFLGTVLFPLWALICSGPRNALIAGVPAIVLKNVLCREVWKQALRNPFSREARLARRLRALGRLPTIGNLLELFQTTQALWGFGIVLGGLYAMMMELLFTLGGGGRRGSPHVADAVLYGPVGSRLAAKVAAMSAGERLVSEQAARVVSGAYGVLKHADVLTDDEHYAHMTALLGAVPVVAQFFADDDAPAFMEAVLAGEFSAPSMIGENLRDFLAEVPGVAAGLGTWPVPGAPRVMRGADLIPALAQQVMTGCEAFLRPRRNTTVATFYGAATCQLSEQLWLMIGQDDGAIQFRLSTDYKLLTALMVDGYLPRNGEDEGKLWRWWTAARALQEARDGELLYPADWVRLADAAGIDLLKILDPSAAIPEEWRGFGLHPERFVLPQ
jgi:hypothetical protein